MSRRPSTKHVPPGPCDGGLPLHLLSRESRRQASDSDTDSISSGFFPVEANQEQDKIGGLNNNYASSQSELQSQELNSAYIYSWVPRLVDDELCFEGDLVDLDEEDEDDSNSILAERFTTGPIIERLNGVIIKTRSKTYVLEGQMAVSVIEGEKDVDTPHFIRHKFKMGVPENWEILVKQWILILAKNIQNRRTMSLIYESLRSFSSFSCRSSMVSDLPRRSSSSDESEISVCSTKPQRELNLSINKQTIVDILPCDKVESRDFKDVYLSSSEDVDSLNDKDHCDGKPLDSPSHDDCDEVSNKKELEIVEIEDDSLRENVDNVNLFEEGDGDDFENREESKRKSNVLKPRPESRRTDVDETVDFEDARRYCKSCNKILKKPTKHYATPYHLKVVEEQEKFPELIGPMDDYDKDATYACEACRFSTDDMKTIRAHTELNNHKMKISNRDKIVLFCNLCNFSSKANDKFYIHIDNKEHARRMIRQKHSTNQTEADKSILFDSLDWIPRKKKAKNT